MDKICWQAKNVLYINLCKSRIEEGCVEGSENAKILSKHDCKIQVYMLAFVLQDIN